MNKIQKEEVVKHLVEQFNTFDCFYIIDAMGLTVDQTNQFRKCCVRWGLRYEVVKNTLIQKALLQVVEREVYEPFFVKVLKGFSGIVFSDKGGSVPAKALKDFCKEEQLSLPVLKGASVDGDLFIGADQLDLLSKLKSKEEVIGDIVSLLGSPLANVMRAIGSGGQRLMGIVQVLSKDRS